MSSLYFIAGASGSGKTAMMNDLQKILGNSVAVYDLDDIGVPDDADKKWRQAGEGAWVGFMEGSHYFSCLRR